MQFEADHGGVGLACCGYVRSWPYSDTAGCKDNVRFGAQRRLSSVINSDSKTFGRKERDAPGCSRTVTNYRPQSTSPTKTCQGERQAKSVR
jgi:hypothetical protein